MGNGFAHQVTSQKNPDTLPDHLGGHLQKTHIDRGAFLYVLNNFDIKSMLDIGCGPGGMIEYARLRDVEAFGIDGDFTLTYPDEIKPYVLVHDFTKGPAPIGSTFDLGWSVEFLEHVEEQYIPNFMDSFQRCKYVVCTAAPPGWNGHHHVNLQPMEYWIKVFDQYGFDYSESDTTNIRELSTMQKPFMQRTGMFFKKKK
jgi:SAM-dependent methyltransferase